MGREDLARATLEGVACGLVDALESLRSHATVDGRVMLVGGLAQSVAFRRVLAGLVDLPIVVSDAEQAVATGAAVQAAAVLEQVEPTVVQERWGLGTGDRGRPMHSSPAISASATPNCANSIDDRSVRRARPST